MLNGAKRFMLLHHGFIIILPLKSLPHLHEENTFYHPEFGQNRL